MCAYPPGNRTHSLVVLTYWNESCSVQYGIVISNSLLQDCLHSSYPTSEVVTEYSTVGNSKRSQTLDSHFNFGTLRNSPRESQGHPKGNFEGKPWDVWNKQDLVSVWVFYFIDSQQKYSTYGGMALQITLKTGVHCNIVMFMWFVGIQISKTQQIRNQPFWVLYSNLLTKWQRDNLQLAEHFTYVQMKLKFSWFQVSFFVKLFNVC